MNPALFKLIRLQSRGMVRRSLHGVTTPRRAGFLLAGFAVLVLWIGPALFAASRQRPAPQRLRDTAPMALLGICVLTIVSSAGDKAISFTPGEVDMLFAAPFSRRELLAFKLIKSTLAALLTAAILSAAMLPYAQWWPAMYIGIVLTLVFVQLFSTVGVLAAQGLGQRAHSTMQRTILGLALVVAFFFAREFVASQGGMQAMYRFRTTDVGEKVLAPFVPFADAMTAGTAIELVLAGGEALVINGCLLALVILFDANYVEAAMGASRRRYAQIQRIRSGSLLSSGIQGDRRWSLPKPPWLWGAGPIIWRQATSAVRSAKGLLIVMCIVAIAAAPLFGAVLRTAALTGTITTLLAGILVWGTILLSSLLKFDFRGDLDHMEELKVLPLAPAALAAGQIVVPTLILSVAHVLLLGSIAAIVPQGRDALAATAVLSLPFNALLMAAENFIFLLFPSRPAAVSPGDFQVLGRQAAQLVMKALTVVTGCVIALVVAAPFWMLSGSTIVLTLIAGAVLSAEAVALVPAIAWAYRRFDPSVDTPA